MAAAVLNFSLQWGSERCFTGVLYWCSDILLNSLPPWGLLGAYRTFGLCLMRLVTECSASESCLLRLLFFLQERLFQFKKLHYIYLFRFFHSFLFIFYDVSRILEGIVQRYVILWLYLRLIICDNGVTTDIYCQEFRPVG